MKAKTLVHGLGCSYAILRDKKTGEIFHYDGFELKAYGGGAIPVVITEDIMEREDWVGVK